jgi:hypothetical protein
MLTEAQAPALAVTPQRYVPQHILFHSQEHDLWAVSTQVILRSRDEARKEAEWLSRNYGLPISGSRRIDLSGKRFGRLVVTAHVGDGTWTCICDCGARVVINGNNLRRKDGTKSCGCLKRIDLTGRRFGRWRIDGYAGDTKWHCTCDCGTHVVVSGQVLRRGHSKSCGCLRRELAKARSTKHGMTGTPEYRSWRNMKQRCFNPRRDRYEYYGGRGITPCEDWLSFVPFFADMESRPEGCSLDRIDPNGNYEPSNCRWATSQQQRQNRRPPQASGRRRPALLRSGAASFQRESPKSFLGQ